MDLDNQLIERDGENVINVRGMYFEQGDVIGETFARISMYKTFKESEQQSEMEPTQNSIKKVLLASSLRDEHSGNVLAWSNEFAKSISANLEVVHVVKPAAIWQILLNLSSVEDSIRENFKEAEIKMGQIMKSLPYADERIKTHFTCTDADDIGDKIIKIGKNAGADLIIFEDQSKLMNSHILDKVSSESGIPFVIIGKTHN
ncbi:MAG: universal stress protein [Bacteriovoracaceae bacterium]|jgi:hypothetical protein|nr:universal stress protein [Bacteriovoracaceae bacterium]